MRAFVRSFDGRKRRKRRPRQCPATGEELTADDLVEVQSDKAVKPRPVEAASIPGQLAMMQVRLFVLDVCVHTCLVCGPRQKGEKDHRTGILLSWLWCGCNGVIW